VGFSHRDFRAERTAREAFWGVLGLVAAVSAIAFVTSSPLVGLATLVGLAVVGGGSLLASERVLEEYDRDLRSAQAEDLHGWLQAEAGHEVGFERAVGLPTQRSPHARSPAERTPPLKLGPEP
jgi:hypothetical protein